MASIEEICKSKYNITRKLKKLLEKGDTVNIQCLINSAKTLKNNQMILEILKEYGKEVESKKAKIKILEQKIKENVLIKN